jgi:hypothetical protein
MGIVIAAAAAVVFIIVIGLLSRRVAVCHKYCVAEEHNNIVRYNIIILYYLM